MPPMKPWPLNNPNRPAPKKPPARPPMKLRAKDGAACGCWTGGAEKPGRCGLAGWVMERSMGAAGLGAVWVAGGAEKVLDPRLPMEPRSPKRACASGMATMLRLKIRTKARVKCLNASVDNMVVFSPRTVSDRANKRHSFQNKPFISCADMGFVRPKTRSIRMKRASFSLSQENRDQSGLVSARKGGKTG